MTWEKPRFTSQFEKRRLRIINALFTVASNLSFKPDIRIKDASSLSIKVNDISVSFTLDAINSKPTYNEDRKPIDDDKTKMHLIIETRYSSEGVRTTWEDNDDGKIEDWLHEIFEEIIVTAEVIYRSSKVFQHDWLVERKADLIEKERKRIEQERQNEIDRLKAIEQANIDKLLEGAENFNRAKAIRQFTKNILGEDQTEEAQAWAKWALGQADRIDPVISKDYLNYKV